MLRPGGAFLIFDLRRDLGPAPWLLIWFATHVVVPPALRHIGEPLGSRNAAYTPDEAAGSAANVSPDRVARGPRTLLAQHRRVHGVTPDLNRSDVT